MQVEGEGEEPGGEKRRRNRWWPSSRLDSNKNVMQMLRCAGAGLVLVQLLLLLDCQYWLRLVMVGWEMGLLENGGLNLKAVPTAQHSDWWWWWWWQWCVTGC